MNKILLFMLLSHITLSVMAQNHSPMEKKPLISVNDAGVAINGFDTVAYFEQNKAVRGSQEFSCDYKEATWYFTSAENRDRFLQNPEKFAPQYGGYCTHALAKNQLINAQPDAFVINNNQLYLYSKKTFAQESKFTFKQEQRVREQNWLSFHKTFSWPRSSLAK